MNIVIYCINNVTITSDCSQCERSDTKHNTNIIVSHEPLRACTNSETHCWYSRNHVVMSSDLWEFYMWGSLIRDFGIGWKNFRLPLLFAVRDALKILKKYKKIKIWANTRRSPRIDRNDSRRISEVGSIAPKECLWMRLSRSNELRTDKQMDKRTAAPLYLVGL